MLFVNNATNEIPDANELKIFVFRIKTSISVFATLDYFLRRKLVYSMLGLNIFIALYFHMLVTVRDRVSQLRNTTAVNFNPLERRPTPGRWLQPLHIHGPVNK
jgi:hypothetical protein